MLLLELLKSNIDVPLPDETTVLEQFSNFVKVLRKKWFKSHSIWRDFLAENEIWLNGEMEMCLIGSDLPGPSTRGRRRAMFSEAGPLTKRRRVQSLLNDKTLEELSFATVHKPTTYLFLYRKLVN